MHVFRSFQLCSYLVIARMELQNMVRHFVAHKQVWHINLVNLWLSPGQTIATCQHNISQHCWAQHVVCIWPPFCDMLRHVGCCLLKFENGQIWANNTTPNMLQHIATHRNTSQQGGQTHTTCCTQQCCNKFCWHAAIVWPGLKTLLRSVGTLNTQI